MNRRISYLECRDFTNIMDGYHKLGMKFSNCLDGGAGAGHTAVKMLPYLAEPGKIFAFEPFPGNFPFIDKINNPNIQFHCCPK